MRYWAALSATLVVGLLATSAWPRMHAGPSMLEAGHRLQGAIGVLDGGGSFGSPTAAYSFRKLKSTYAGPAIKLRRTTGGVQDIGFLGFVPGLGAPLDVAAAGVFCAATTCFLDTMYDQSGNARHAVQATTALQPQFVFNCIGALQCMRTTAAGQKLVTAGNITTATGKGTLNAVAMRLEPSAPTDCNPLGLASGTGLRMFINNGHEEWALTDTVTYLVPAAPDAAWHSGTGVINGASSVFRLDGNEVAGTIAGKVTTGPVSLADQPNTGATCNYVEAMYWDAYALTPAERTALTANQKSFWGF